MRKYPLSAKIKEAIETIFTDPEDAYIALGAKRVLDEHAYQEAPSTDINFRQRAIMLRKEIEDFIALRAAEYSQVDDEYQDLLDSLNDDNLNFDLRNKIEFEVKMLLVVLRWLNQYLPEAFDTE